MLIFRKADDAAIRRTTKRRDENAIVVYQFNVNLISVILKQDVSILQVTVRDFVSVEGGNHLLKFGCNGSEHVGILQILLNESAQREPVRPFHASDGIFGAPHPNAFGKVFKIDKVGQIRLS